MSNRKWYGVVGVTNTSNSPSKYLRFVKNTNILNETGLVSEQMDNWKRNDLGCRRCLLCNGLLKPLNVGDEVWITEYDLNVPKSRHKRYFYSHELRKEIPWFIYIGLSEFSYYDIEVIKMNKERELRRSLKISDTYGFGALRGILTGNTEENPENPEYPEYFVLDSLPDNCSASGVLNALKSAEKQTALAKALYDYYVEIITNPHSSVEEAELAMKAYDKLMPQLDLAHKHHRDLMKLANKYL